MTPSFNAEVVGFNANGMVIVRAGSGSLVTAVQMGNGQLVPGQPVVLQLSGTPGLSSVCFDPTATPVQPRVWPKQPEQTSTDDWEYAVLRTDSYTSALGLTNAAGQPMPSWDVYILPPDRATKWVSLSAAKLREYGHMSIAQLWTSDYASRNFSPIPQYGDGTLPPSVSFETGLNPLLAGNEIKFVLRAKRAFTVTRIRASSSFQPGGEQFDPSPTGQSLTNTAGVNVGPQKLRQILDFSAIREGKEVTNLKNTYLTGVDISNSYWRSYNLSKAWYDGDSLSMLEYYNSNPASYRLEQFTEGGYNSYRRGEPNGTGPLFLSGPGVVNSTPVLVEDVANTETVLNYMRMIANRQLDEGLSIGVPVRASNMATFTRKPLLGGSQRQQLSYSAAPKPGSARFAKGDLLYVYSSAGFYNWRPGDTPWQIQAIETTAN